MSYNPTSNPIVITMDADHTLNAVFTDLPEVNYTLNIQQASGGSTTPQGTLVLTAGTTQNVTASAAANYVFDHWLLDGATRTENPISVLMNANHTLTPVFVYVPPTFAVTVSVGSGGIVTPWSGTQMRQEGATVTFTAVPDTDYVFTYWTVNGVSHTENPLTLTVTGDLDINAYFDYNPPVDCNIASDCESKYGAAPTGSHWECQNNTCVLVEDSPVPPPPCFVAYIGTPQKALTALRTQIRSRLPFWVVKNYYKLSLFILNNGE